MWKPLFTTARRKTRGERRRARSEKARSERPRESGGWEAKASEPARQIASSWPAVFDLGLSPVGETDCNLNENLGLVRLKLYFRAKTQAIGKNLVLTRSALSTSRGLNDLHRYSIGQQRQEDLLVRCKCVGLQILYALSFGVTTSAFFTACDVCGSGDRLLFRFETAPST